MSWTITVLIASFSAYAHLFHVFGIILWPFFHLCRLIKTQNCPSDTKELLQLPVTVTASLPVLIPQPLVPSPSLQGGRFDNVR